jgi:hypothetical protein
MSNTDIIIFSKSRSLQLKSLLRSIRHYSDIRDDEINVIYTTVPQIPYESLTSEFGCRFIPQGDFLTDLKNIIDGSPNKYVLFMVDDLIFKDSFSLRKIEDFLDGKSEVDCFSLRLGKNIQDGTSPQFVSESDGMLVWDTGKGLGKLWNFFWEVSASAYRKSLVTKYLRKCNSGRVSYPNPLESYYYTRMPSHRPRGSSIKQILLALHFLGANKTNRMACFEKSKCFTLGVNLVAERNIDYKTVAGPEELHKKMHEGFVVDYLSIEQVENEWPNAGAKYFQLIKEPNGDE